MNRNKIYIGDSVYAEFDGYMVTLTTNNGSGPTNTIHLEPQVWESLKLVVEAWKKEGTEEGVTQ